MRFHMIRLQTPNPAQSPLRVIEHESGREVSWLNRYLDREYVRTPWRCSGGACRLVLPATASTGFPIASPKSLPKRANSAHPENGQRLAG